MLTGSRAMQNLGRSGGRAGPLLRMLLAVLVLVSQLLAPGLQASMDEAMAAGASARLLSHFPICESHRGPADPADRGPARPPSEHQHYCVFCAFCHQLMTSALMPAGPLGVDAPILVPVAGIALPPPATGPPGQPRYTAARPRGPPAFSA